MTTGPHGDIAGKVTDSGTGAPVKGAPVKTTDGYADTTEADGSYDLSVPVGTYDVTAQAFGYQAKTTSGVVVTDSHTTALDAALASVPSQNVSGTVTDGSGHGWPLYAKITIDGYPGGAIYTDPYTGYYSVDLPQDADYTLHITPVAQGYATKDLSVAVGDSDEVANTNVTVDATTCVAPGYAYKYTGTGEQFAGWTGSTTKDGWTNVDNKGNAQTWQFETRATGRSRRVGIRSSRSSTPTTTASAAARTVRWCRRSRTCPARQLPRSASTRTTTGTPTL